MRLVACVIVASSLACGHPTSTPRPDADLAAKAQVVDARLADVRAALDRRAALQARAHDDHDSHVELEGADNRVL